MTDEIKQEFKTIRISAVTYYKLVELTGIFNTISGVNFSLTTTADMILTGVHTLWYPEFIKLLGNQTEMEKARKKLQEDLKYAFEISKNIKIPK